MVELWRQKPVIKFFGEVIFMALAVSILIWILGLLLDWSRPVHYSDGFFFASVALAAVSSSLAIFKRPGLKKEMESETPKIKIEQEFTSKSERFFATRSFNFKMLISALICFIISVLIAQ